MGYCQYRFSELSAIIDRSCKRLKQEVADGRLGVERT